GATGWVMFVGAVRVITDHKVDGTNITNLSNLLSPLALTKLGVAAAFAVSLYRVLRRRPHPLALPGLILAGVAVGLVGLHLSGVSLPQAQALGWTFKPQAGVGLNSPFD